MLAVANSWKLQDIFGVFRKKPAKQVGTSRLMNHERVSRERSDTRL